MKTCKQCGAEFTASYPKRSYCDKHTYKRKHPKEEIRRERNRERWQRVKLWVEMIRNTNDDNPLR